MNAVEPELDLVPLVEFEPEFEPIVGLADDPPPPHPIPNRPSASDSASKNPSRRSFMADARA